LRNTARSRSQRAVPRILAILALEEAGEQRDPLSHLWCEAQGNGLFGDCYELGGSPVVLLGIEAHGCVVGDRLRVQGGVPVKLPEHVVAHLLPADPQVPLFVSHDNLPGQ
jgi:hypothetical protein